MISNGLSYIYSLKLVFLNHYCSKQPEFFQRRLFQQYRRIPVLAGRSGEGLVSLGFADFRRASAPTDPQRGLLGQALRRKAAVVVVLFLEGVSFL
jgi:hypothetical protein